MKFGENLYNLRKSSKMSQEKLAEKMDVSRQSVSKWENGESYPEMEKIMKLCNIFHCKINDLVHEDMSDINSLDEDIKMSVVKFKKEKQKKMKGLSKALYIIARIAKIIVTISIPIIILCMIILPYIIGNIYLVEDKLIYNGINQKISLIGENNNDTSLELKVDGQNLTDEDIATIKNMFEHNSKTLIIVYIEMGFLVLISSVILIRVILQHLEDLFVNINNGDTPFTLENVKHIKKIAYLMIATIVLSNLSEIIFELILKAGANAKIELFDVIEILFLFSMSYIFEYGHEIQLDSNGKIYGDEK